MKRILIFKIKDVCYQSYLYFADALGAALVDEGYDVTYYDSSLEPLEHLDRLCGCSYTAMIDFNSVLPKLKLDSGAYFLDTVDAPFFDIILDHPLYHHDMLKQTLSDFHVLCLDENHLSYLRTYYPHLKSVSFFPMTGSAVTPSVPFEERTLPLLFTGGYTPSAQIRDVISNLPDFLRNDTFLILELLQADSSLTIEDASLKLLRDRFDFSMELLPLQVQSFFLADTYQRAYERENVLSTLLAQDIPVTVCGENWDAFSYSGKNLTRLLACSFEKTFSLMQQAKVVLNVLPDFKAGVHDRIYSAMLNGAVSLTDSSTYLLRHFQNETDILFFNPANPALLTSNTAISSFLSDTDALTSIALAGQKKAKKSHTWKSRAALFTTLLPDEDVSP